MKSLQIKLTLFCALVTFRVAAQAPTITSFTPEIGPVSTLVTITGENFAPEAADNFVYFGAVKAYVLTASPTQLQAFVPSGASYEPITVTVNGLTAFSSKPFVQTFSYSSGTFLNEGTLPSGIQVKWSTVTGINPSTSLLGIVVVDEAANQVTIWMKDGTAYNSSVSYPTSPGPYAVEAEDLNGDGKKDIIVTSTNGTVGVLQNAIDDTGISFLPEVSFATAPTPLFISVSDLNKDGKPDLAVACANNFGTGVVSILENTSSGGTISFAPRVDLPVGNGGVWCVRLADIDGDAKEDVLVTSGGSNWFSVFKNTNAGGSLDASSFAPRVDFATGAYPAIITVSDFDGDGKPDAAVGNQNGNSISIFHNVSIPGVIDPSSFASQTLFNQNSWNPTAGDIDGDGRHEIVIRNQFGDLQIFQNNSSPGFIAFTPTSVIPVGGSPLGIDVVDVSSDGLADLVVSNEGFNVVHVMTNIGLFPPETLGVDMISNTGFVPTWSYRGQGTSFRIDVSTTSDFSVPVEGWYDREVVSGEGWSSLYTSVGGLNPATKYYYRLRSVVFGMVSANSETAEVETLPHPPMMSPNLWVKSFGDASMEEVQSMVSDNSGDIYIGGYFSGTLNLGATTLQCNSESFRDIFIAKMDPTGNVIWATALGGPGFNNEVSLALQGNALYVAAQFSGSIDVDPGAATQIFNNEGSPLVDDSFFAKYSAKNGQLEWARHLNDAAGWSSTSIAVDKSSVYLAGHFMGSVDFNTEAGVFLQNSTGGEDVFLAAYTLKGNFKWARQMGGENNDSAWGLLVDDGVVFVHGKIDGFGGFLASYDAKSGTDKWMRSIGEGTVFTAAKFREKLYVAGDFKLVNVIYPEEIYLGNFSYDNTHGFVAEIEPKTGHINWANDMLTTSYIGPRKILVDESGIYVNGYFGGTVHFREANFYAIEAIRTSAWNDAFVVNYSHDGIVRWAKGIGAPGRATSIAATLTKSAYYLAGNYATDVNFDPYTGSAFRSSVGGSDDIFVAKYQREKNMTHSETVEGAEGEILAQRIGDDPSQGIMLYPNPAGETLTIRVAEFSTGQVELSIKDVMGRTAIASWDGAREQTIRVGHLTSGVYFVKARQGDKMLTKRFIKK